MVAKGRIWIESESGRVVKTELAVNELDNIVTSFRFDQRFQIAIPVEMREEYWTDTESIVGVASYSRFRRFDVTTDEEFQDRAAAQSPASRRVPARGSHHRAPRSAAEPRSSDTPRSSPETTAIAP